MKYAYPLLVCIIILTSTFITNAQTLDWAIGMGSAVYDDIGASIYIDLQGNVYSTGNFSQTVDFDPGPGVYNLSGSDMTPYLAKYDAAGNFVWALKIGYYGAGTTITHDENENIVVAGAFEGTSDFDPGPGSLNLTSAGLWDIFIAKYTPDGDFLWAQRIGGVGLDRPADVQIDIMGNIHMVGFFSGAVDFNPGSGTTNRISSGHNDIFLAKYDSDFNLLWVNTMGSFSGDEGTGLAIDTIGNVFLTGWYHYSVDFDPGPGTAIPSNAVGYINYFFLAKYDPNGNFLWVNSIGGPGFAFGNDIAINSSGNICVTGYFSYTADFDPGPGVSLLISTPNHEGGIFVAQYNGETGNLIWANGINAQNPGRGISLDIDHNDNIYVLGLVWNNIDIILVKINNEGHPEWYRSLGNSGNDQGLEVKTVADTIYITGGFSYTVDFDIGPCNFPLTANDFTDIFIAKYIPCQAVETAEAVSICQGQTYVFNDQLLTEPGQYTTVFPTALCCDSTVHLTLTVLPPFDILPATQAPDCPDYPGQLTVAVEGGIEPYQYSVGSGAWQSAPTFSDLLPGDYSLSVQDDFGCVDSTIITIPPATDLMLYFDQDTFLLTEGDRIWLHPNANFMVESFEWQPVLGLECADCSQTFASPLDTITYTLRVISLEGCEVTTSVTIDVKRKRHIFIPNAFSPNGDAINDRFTLFADDQVATVLNMTVFDRWGGEVFHAADFAPGSPTGWDGKANGRQLPAGMYVYLFEIQFTDGAVEFFKGEVTLVD